MSCMEVDAASARNFAHLTLKKSRQDKTKNEWRMELTDVLIFFQMFLDEKYLVMT